MKNFVFVEFAHKFPGLFQFEIVASRTSDELSSLRLIQNGVSDYRRKGFICGIVGRNNFVAGTGLVNVKAEFQGVHLSFGVAYSLSELLCLRFHFFKLADELVILAKDTGGDKLDFRLCFGFLTNFFQLGLPVL